MKINQVMCEKGKLGGGGYIIFETTYEGSITTRWKLAQQMSNHINVELNQKDFDYQMTLNLRFYVIHFI